MKSEYKDIKEVRKAVKQILKVIRPGDVINTSGKAPLSLNSIPTMIAYAAIRAYQKNLFGKSAKWSDTHSTIFFDQWNIASVEPPKATYIPLKSCAMDDISIYRYTKKVLTDDDIETIMMEYDDVLYGTSYDYLQLPDIALTTIFGYPGRFYEFISRDKQAVVCSVGAFAGYTAMTKKNKLPTIFTAFNENTWREAHPKWSSRKLRRTFRRDKDDWNATSPAHFANTNFFDNEFECVAEFDHGKRVN